MDQEEFTTTIMNRLPVGYVFDNPGGGQTTILGYSTEPVAVRYLRGKSEIRVAVRDLFKAYIHFQGKCMSSTNLREYAPNIFDSKARPAGHSCNCTFLFHVLQVNDLTDGGIQGGGVRGDPYYIQVDP